MTEEVEKRNESLQFYGEWVFYEGEEERNEAETYLKLWAKFYPKKLNVKVLSTSDLIERQDIFGSGKTTLGIKIATVGNV